MHNESAPSKNRRRLHAATTKGALTKICIFTNLAQTLKLVLHYLIRILFSKNFNKFFLRLIAIDIILEKSLTLTYRAYGRFQQFYYTV